MTLAEMADFVCGKVRQSDATSVQKAKDYLARRYQMIWDQELWKDSVWAYDFAFNTQGTLGAAENDNIVGNVYAALRGAWLFPSAVDKVLALRQAEGELSVASEQDFYRISADLYADTGPAVRFHQMPRICCYSDVVSDVSDDSTTFVLAAADASVADQVSVRYLDRWGDVRNVTGLGPFFAEAFLSVTKPVTTGNLEFQNTDTDVTYLSMGAGLESMPLRSRIRLSPIPTSDVSLKALVKLKAEVMEDDGDEPQITGIEDCLMAFAQADMLQRARQYGKAQLVQQEAIELLKQLKISGVAQEAHVQQITPVVAEPSGSVDFISGKGFW